MASVCIITAFAQGDEVGKRLVAAYRTGAAEGGHAVQVIDINALNFDPFSYTYAYLHSQTLEEDLHAAVRKMLQSDHLAIFVPVFKAYLPAVVQSFFQQLFTPDSYGKPQPGIWGAMPFLHLKTARIVSLLDPESWAAFHKDRSARFHPLKKSVLEVLGFRKVRTTTVPPVYDVQDENEYLHKWLLKIRELGRKNF